MGASADPPMVLRREGLCDAGGCKYPSTDTWEPARDGRLFEIEGGSMDGGSSVRGVSSVLGAYADCEVRSDDLVSADERCRRPWEPDRDERSREAEEVRSRGSSNVTGRGEPPACDDEDATGLRGTGGGVSSSSTSSFTLDGGEGGGGPAFESALPSRRAGWKAGTALTSDAPTRWITDSGMGPVSSFTVLSVTLTMWTSCAGDCFPPAKARACTGLMRSPSRECVLDDARCKEEIGWGDARWFGEDETLVRWGSSKDAGDEVRAIGMAAVAIGEGKQRGVC